MDRVAIFDNVKSTISKLITSEDGCVAYIGYSNG